MEKINQIVEKHGNKLIILILFIAFFTRIMLLDKIPNAKHIDEAGIMYDSYCFANYGVDRYLNERPVYLINFGGGQSILYTLISSIFVKIFGYKLFFIRLPAAIFSIIYIVSAYFIIKKFKNKKIALLVAFLITIMPWTFMQSRYALDCNLMASLMLIAISMLLNSKKKWQYIISGVLFGITLYTYILSLIILPVFLILISLYLIYTKKSKISDIVCVAIPIIIFVIPLLIFLLYNNGNIQIGENSFFTYPKMFRFRNSEISLGNIANNIIKIFIDFFTIDIKKFGEFYYISRVFFLIGLVITIIKIPSKLKTKKFDLDILFMINLISGIALLCANNIEIYKANAIIISYIYFVACGIVLIMKEWKKTIIPILSLYVLLFIAFQIYYFTVYSKQDSNELWNSSISDVINYVETNFENDKIYMACACYEPYIYQLVENPISPYEFNKDRYVIDNKVSKYGKYSFNNYYKEIDKKTVCIIKDVEYYQNSPFIQSMVEILKNNNFKKETYASHGEKYEIYYLKRK